MWYVIPMRIKGSADVDTILSGKTSKTNSDPRVAGNWDIVPKNFTMEAEVKFDNPQDTRLIWAFASKGDNEQLLIWSSAKSDEYFFYIKRGSPYEEFGRNLGRDRPALERRAKNLLRDVLPQSEERSP
jgi:hypothetical protein